MSNFTDMCKQYAEAAGGTQHMTMGLARVELQENIHGEKAVYAFDSVQDARRYLEEIQKHNQSTYKKFVVDISLFNMPDTAIFPKPSKDNPATSTVDYALYYLDIANNANFWVEYIQYTLGEKVEGKHIDLSQLLRKSVDSGKLPIDAYLPRITVSGPGRRYEPYKVKVFHNDLDSVLHLVLRLGNYDLFEYLVVEKGFDVFKESSKHQHVIEPWISHTSSFAERWVDRSPFTIIEHNMDKSRFMELCNRFILPDVKKKNSSGQEYQYVIAAMQEIIKNTTEPSSFIKYMTNEAGFKLLFEETTRNRFIKELESLFKPEHEKLFDQLTDKEIEMVISYLSFLASKFPDNKEVNDLLSRLTEALSKSENPRLIDHFMGMTVKFHPKSSLSAKIIFQEKELERLLARFNDKDPTIRKNFIKTFGGLKNSEYSALQSQLTAFVYFLAFNVISPSARKEIQKIIDSLGPNATIEQAISEIEALSQNEDIAKSWTKRLFCQEMLKGIRMMQDRSKHENDHLTAPLIEKAVKNPHVSQPETGAGVPSNVNPGINESSKERGTPSATTDNIRVGTLSIFSAGPKILQGDLQANVSLKLQLQDIAKRAGIKQFLDCNSVSKTLRDIFTRLEDTTPIDKIIDELWNLGNSDLIKQNPLGLKFLQEVINEVGNAQPERENSHEAGKNDKISTEASRDLTLSKKELFNIFAPIEAKLGRSNNMANLIQDIFNQLDTDVTTNQVFEKLTQLSSQERTENDFFEMELFKDFFDEVSHIQPNSENKKYRM